MDVGIGTRIQNQNDPVGNSTRSVWQQKYSVDANRSDILLEYLVIGGGGGAGLGYSASDSGAGGGGAQLSTANGNVTVNTVYDFNIGSGGKNTWVDNGSNTSYPWSGGPSGQNSESFANTAFSLYGGNTGPGIPAGGPFPGIGGWQFSLPGQVWSGTSNATMTAAGLGDDGISNDFTGTSVIYCAGGGGESQGDPTNNGSAGAGNLNYGSGGSVASTGIYQYQRAIDQAKDGVIYIKHIKNGDRRIYL